MGSIEGMTKYIGYVGAPSSGKSTAAAKHYARLKRQRAKVVLVTESAMEQSVLYKQVAQPATFGEQMRRELMWLDSGYTVISDSPMELQAYYARRFTNVVRNYRALWPHRKLVWLECDGSRYQQAGRIHTASECMSINNLMKYFFEQQGWIPE